MSEAPSDNSKNKKEMAFLRKKVTILYNTKNQNNILIVRMLLQNHRIVLSNNNSKVLTLISTIPVFNYFVTMAVGWTISAG